jgi:hypothetical protein
METREKFWAKRQAALASSLLRPIVNITPFTQRPKQDFRRQVVAGIVSVSVYLGGAYFEMYDRALSSAASN